MYFNRNQNMISKTKDNFRKAPGRFLGLAFCKFSNHFVCHVPCWVPPSRLALRLHYEERRLAQLRRSAARRRLAAAGVCFAAVFKDALSLLVGLVAFSILPAINNIIFIKQIETGLFGIHFTFNVDNKVQCERTQET